MRLFERMDLRLSSLDRLMDIAAGSGLGQDQAPDGLREGFHGMLSHSTQAYQDAAGNWWYNKKYSDSDFWIMHDELLNAIGHQS